jgi:predicted nucleic acid-binding protein
VILCDTSAWVEYDRGTGSVTDLRLKALIAADGPIAVTEPIVMEVIAGAVGPERAEDLRRLVLRFAFIGFDSAADFDGAAWIYRTCRAKGVTPRGMVDCMIAAVALRSRASLLAHDLDLDRVARVVGIPMDRASLRTKGVRRSGS